MADLPPTSDLDISATYSFQASKDVLQAKYTDTIAWAQWAGQLLNSNITDIEQLLGSDTVNADIDALNTDIGTLLASIPGTLTASTNVFTDTLLTQLRSKLESDITASSTGLGTAEAALFARETARQNAARSLAYTEITTQFSSRGFDMPPGALLAKQTEINTESTTRLSDSSSQIMAESARLAVDYNKHVLSTSSQLLALLAAAFDSYEMRAFEAAKTTALLAVDDYKSALGLMQVKADIVLKKGDLVLTNKARQLQLEVSTLAGLAQSAAQMVAASLNGVSVSSSFGWSASSGYSASEDVNRARTNDVSQTQAL